MLVNTMLPHRDVIWRDVQGAALAIGLRPQRFEVRGPEDFERGLTSKASESFQALIVHPDPLAFNHRREIAEFGLKKKMPNMRQPASANPYAAMIVVRHLQAGPVPPRRDLCGQDPQRCQAGRSAHRAAGQVRADPELEDRQSARAHHPAVAPPAGG